MIKISPSILASDFASLGDEARSMENAGAQMLHIDVMDGHFVPNISFGAPIMKAIRPCFSGCFDVHLMISDPRKYLKDFAKAGADLITIHAECDSDISATLAEIRAMGLKAGLSLKPNTPAEAVFSYMNQLDLILVMTVEPGFGGQSFMTNMLEKISVIRNQINSSRNIIDLEVDGGINAQTGKLCVEHGANVLVAGSYLFSNQKEDYKKAVESLM